MKKFMLCACTAVALVFGFEADGMEYQRSDTSGSVTYKVATVPPINIAQSGDWFRFETLDSTFLTKNALTLSSSICAGIPMLAPLSINDYQLKLKVC